MPLTDEQRKVLDALMAEDAGPALKTEAALQDRTGIDHVGRVLRELEAFDPPLVEHGVDDVLGTRVWIPTVAAADLLDIEI
jgi:hypothetical protein